MNYNVTEVVVDNVTHYGIQMISNGDVIDYIKDISINRSNVEELAEKCNSLEVSEVHFRDVVLDYISKI